MTRNSFPMKDWHTEHMQKTVVKYVKGLSENASAFERRNHKKYCSITSVCRQIEYDIKHGVSQEEVTSMLHKVRHNSSYSNIHDKSGESMARLEEIELHFKGAGKSRSSWTGMSDLTYHSLK